MQRKRVLVIYTGGTIGMVQDGSQTGSLRPVDFFNLAALVPEISRMQLDLDYFSFQQPIDSSNMLPEIWLLLARIIGEGYSRYDGFVVLHGTDTMAYTAAMLSFLLQDLAKPVILTGAQLPIDRVRSDGRENLITALEIAAHPTHSVPEVCVCFDSKLFRGNRTLKYSSEKFRAFASPNYPPLAEAGVHLELYRSNWLPTPPAPLVVHHHVEPAVGLLKFYPGIPQAVVQAVVHTPGLRGLVLETYGTGNVPEFDWLAQLLRQRIADGLVMLNVSQCPAGGVEQGMYRAGSLLQEMGVVSGHDMTTEAALAKLMFLLGQHQQAKPVREALAQSIAGEMTTGEAGIYVAEE